MDLAPGPLAELAQLPSSDIPRDVDTLDLGEPGSATTTGPLLEIVRDVHLARPTLVLGLGRAVMALLSRRHRSMPPCLIIVRLGAKHSGAAVDLLGGLA